MNEETTTPYVDWDYILMGPDMAWDNGCRRRTDYPPVGEWHIEFTGATQGHELLLAHYYPSKNEDAREWFKAFGPGSSLLVPVDIQSYFGPTDEPEDDPEEPDNDSGHPGPDLVNVEHSIHIGQGWAKWRKNELIITIPPEVFRDSAARLLLGFSSKYAHIEQRIFRIFEMLSPTEYSEFWDGFKRPVYPNEVFAFYDERREASWRDSLIRFDRPTDFDCLQLLHSASGEVVTYTKLTKVLRPEGVGESIFQFIAPPELKSCISHLRASLKAVNCSCDITNVRGLGYRLSPSR